MTFVARHLSVSIAKPAAEVYEFAAEPMNIPRWAAGLGRSAHFEDGVWIVESPMGRVRVKFAERNRFGVLDHDVTMPDGEVVSNPLRIFPNADGAEVVFTLYRRPLMTDREFENDGAAVMTDLRTLKALMEGR